VEDGPDSDNTHTLVWRVYNSLAEHLALPSGNQRTTPLLSSLLPFDCVEKHTASELDTPRRKALDVTHYTVRGYVLATT